VQLVVPEIEPHEPEDGILHSPAMLPAALPAALPFCGSTGPAPGAAALAALPAQLLSPVLGSRLEADRPAEFVLLAPGERPRLRLGDNTRGPGGDMGW
jgi:hypothetical protein